MVAGGRPVDPPPPPPLPLPAGSRLVSVTVSQSVPAFSGRYRFALNGGRRAAPASMQVGPLNILMDVTEVTVSAGPEVSGRPASTSQTPDNGRFELLRQGKPIHGAFGARTDKLGLDKRGRLPGVDADHDRLRESVARGAVVAPPEGPSARWS